MRKIIEYSLLSKQANDHFNRLNPKLKNPKKDGTIYNECSIYNKLLGFAKKQNPLLLPFFNFLEINLEKIIISSPNELMDLHDQILKEWLKVDSCLKNLEALYESFLNQVFTYASFRKGKGDLSRNILWFKSLNLKSCPYCNRNWISFVKDQKGKNTLYFDIDHFFPKYKYPWFSLSFYNLIPSCTICNQRIKGGKDLLLQDHLHPFIDDFDEIVKFNVPVDTLDVFFDKTVSLVLEIIPRPPITYSDKDFVRAKEYYEFFNLKNLYDFHLDYVREILQKRIIYSRSYILQLQNDYEEIFSSPDEIQRMLFGNYVLPEQIHERPLAKLTKDLAEGLI
jgi:hypothetical protein